MRQQTDNRCYQTFNKKLSRIYYYTHLRQYSTQRYVKYLGNTREIEKLVQYIVRLYVRPIELK